MHNPRDVVRDDECIPILEKTEAYDHLSEFWGKRFKQKTISEDEAAAFTQIFSNKFPMIGWCVRFLEFCSIVMTTKKAAPGPD